MPVVGIIPVRSFHLGKQRLATTLEPARREELGRALTGHVAGIVEEVGLVPLIVTADPLVAHWAVTAGFGTVPDPGEGLDAACAAGVTWAGLSGSAWLVIHSDLPLLLPTDLEVVVSAVDSGREVIAPSSDGGTSVLSARAPIEFAYGSASFHRHLTRLTEPMVVIRPGLLQDIDSPQDLTAARSHPDGAWLPTLMP